MPSTLCVYFCVNYLSLLNKDYLLLCCVRVVVIIPSIDVKFKFGDIIRLCYWIIGSNVQLKNILFIVKPNI